MGVGVSAGASPAGGEASCLHLFIVRDARPLRSMRLRSLTLQPSNYYRQSLIATINCLRFPCRRKSFMNRTA